MTVYPSLDSQRDVTRYASAAEAERVSAVPLADADTGTDDDIEDDDSEGVADRAAEVSALRQKVLRLMLRALARRRSVLASSPSPADWGESLKIVVEMGMHTLDTVPAAGGARAELIDRLDALLAELEDIVVPQHRPGVWGMQAELAGARGVAAFEAGALEEALEHFRAQLRLAERLARGAGGHLLVTPLCRVAGALAPLRRFDESRATFQRALELAAAHFGPEDRTLVLPLVNYGTMLVESGAPPGEARAALQRAMRIMQAQATVGEPFFADLYNRASAQLRRLS